MDKLDLWSDFLIDDSAAPDEATIPLTNLTNNESTDLNITYPNEVLTHNSHEELNFRNNWLSSSPINVNQEQDQLQQSQMMHFNANSHQQQNFNIPSSSTTILTSLANQSRKRRLLDVSSQSSIIGTPSCAIANTNPNTVNQFNSQLDFSTTSGNVENSQRNCRIRMSHNVQPNMLMPINQPVTPVPLIQNACPFSTNVASNSRTSHSFSRYNDTRNINANLRSNTVEGTDNRFSLNPPAHYQLLPQIVNNGSSMFSFDRNVLQSRAAMEWVAILRIQQEMASNSLVSRAARDGQSRNSSESMLSFERAGYHRRVIGLQDRHRDMRLDVDNMSYEELLALEERIGNVNVGLGEEKITKCLKQRKYVSPMVGVLLNEVEPCCICREEYMEDESMGRLDCGHDFHSNCIKKWLMIKNLCPVCKTTGLIT